MGSKIDLSLLPEEAQKEIIELYKKLLESSKKKEKLEKLLTQVKGKLPEDFTFSREEIYER